MESLEQLQKQLDGLAELRTIVKTMKALSAASIRQYENAVDALDGYYQTVERGLQAVLRGAPRSVLSGDRKDSAKRPAAIVFGSDHGLCGRFNEEIAGYVLERLAADGADPQRRRVLAVGARVAASLEHGGQTIAADFPVPGAASHITDTVQRVLLEIDDWRRQGNADSVHLFYNRRSGGSGYRPSGTRLLPLDARRFEELRKKPWPTSGLPGFSMEREVLLSRLLHQYLFVSLFRACAESQASEHASRLSAMQAAQRNLDERLEDVTMHYRRARQSVITAELLDVVAGFEAIAASAR